MALLPILRYPDPRLHKKAKPVAEVDERIRQLARDMAETMYDAPGVGLAATQVDVHERMVVIDVSEDGNQLLTLINPEITWHSDDYKIYEEGCLSVPGIYDEVERAARIRCKALDIDGKPFEFEADGLLAVCAARAGPSGRQGVRGIPVEPQAEPHQDQAEEGRARSRARLIPRFPFLVPSHASRIRRHAGVRSHRL